jgi:hypothetical protein
MRLCECGRRCEFAWSQLCGHCLAVILGQVLHLLK